MQSCVVIYFVRSVIGNTCRIQHMPRASQRACQRGMRVAKGAEGKLLALRLERARAASQVKLGQVLFFGDVIEKVNNTKCARTMQGSHTDVSLRAHMRYTSVSEHTCELK